MDNSNAVKAAKLGEPFGTANSRLRKMLLFDFAKRLNEDTCYRCGTKIENIDDFSIEHKKSWMFSENPIEMFFDLNNISFSHIRCNVGAGAENKRVYPSVLERQRAATKRRYDNPVTYQAHLSYKRDRYQKLKEK